MNQYTQRLIIVLFVILAITSVAYATETTWRHSGFQVYGYDINLFGYNITHGNTVSIENFNNSYSN